MTVGYLQEAVIPWWCIEDLETTYSPLPVLVGNNIIRLIDKAYHNIESAYSLVSLCTVSLMKGSSVG